MDDNFCVYMHINRANGKRYVGITAQNPITRWQNGLGYRRNKHFWDAILKYGWDNFDHLILYSGLRKEVACLIEQHLISEYQTTDKRKGYNLTTGGEYFKHSEETKVLMSQQRKGKGKKKRTPEQIARMKAAHAGGAEQKPVFCIETGRCFNSINDASRETGINKKGISGCCRQIQHYNTAGGYHWRFQD